MSISKKLAKHFREVYFGTNWTWSNIKDNLEDVTWEEANQEVSPLKNTIGVLAYHIHYYVCATKEVLEGRPLNAHDDYAFDLPPITSQQDWDDMREKMWADATQFADLIAQLPDDQWEQIFVKEKYGTYYRNIQGIIEHSHYHLGQIALMKKMIKLSKK